ncbi:TetR/AcrR family transcriptional regulator C-terminal domain-containing protein [Diaminobutyricibacter sp. McL0608]|uniref:TetR/AcrR family transcriptional regulator C-terminal domain-containing protein n=1 Tax=Leifsonia sp. McL0608 TaxID=3143537 RepID=UPI0031F327C2
MSTDALETIWLAREENPSRAPLSRDEIVSAAIRVADHAGASGLTMSAVAKDLGDFSAMALYRHVLSKDGLIDLMLDRAIGEVALPPHESPAGWQSALRTLALETWSMARRHPWYAQLVQTRPPLGPNTMRRTEYALRILVGAGLDVDESLSSLELVDLHVFARANAAAQQERMAALNGVERTDDFVDTVKRLSQTLAPAEEYPLLAQWMQSPTIRSEQEQLERAVDYLLAGIAGRIPAR